MASTRNWLKTVSGALCALLLLVFTVTPAVDALICGAEDAPGASAQVGADEAVAQAAKNSERRDGTAKELAAAVRPLIEAVRRTSWADASVGIAALIENALTRFIQAYYDAKAKASRAY